MEGCFGNIQQTVDHRTLPRVLTPKHNQTLVVEFVLRSRFVEELRPHLPIRTERLLYAQIVKLTRKSNTLLTSPLLVCKMALKRMNNHSDGRVGRMSHERRVDAKENLEKVVIVKELNVSLPASELVESA